MSMLSLNESGAQCRVVNAEDATHFSLFFSHGHCDGYFDGVKLQFNKNTGTYKI